MENKDDLAFTGERFVPTETGDIAVEHLHRYLHASKISDGKAVLDIACGEGYGSALLAGVAKSVVGVDISFEAIRHAVSHYGMGNLSYLEGSCAAIPVADDSIDIVVSFETIEHHDQHHQMMREIKRVLRKDGVLIISSPDKHIYSEVPNRINPFHVKELYGYEFKDLLEGYFSRIQYFGQSVAYGSTIFSDKLAAPFVRYMYEGDNIHEILNMSDPVYWIAVASDGDLPAFPAGFFEQSVDKSEVVRDLTNRIAERDWRIGKLQEQVRELQKVLGARDTDIAKLNSEVSIRQDRITEMEKSAWYRMSEFIRPSRKSGGG